jgi:hypothetical protein
VIPIPDIRIKYDGARLRLRGFGMKKFHNLKILEAGLRSIRARLARGIGEDDQRTAALKKRYAAYKSRVTGRRAIRDMQLTGATLAGIKPRYADDHQATADASGRRGRVVARVNKRLLLFSPADQQVMSEIAHDLFREQASQLFEPLGSPKPGRFQRSSVFTR